MYKLPINLLVLINCLVYVRACTNLLALTKVDAWVHKQNKWNGEKIEGTSFYLLDTYRTIDITKGNVSELCLSSIKDFTNLEELSLISVGLERIEAGAFERVPKLAHLSLAVNNLTEIKRGIFNTIPRLTVLYLSGNKIQYIEDGAFEQLAYLKSVHLDRNQLTSVGGNLFRGCPRIQRLDFSSNQIGKISQDSFQDIRPSSSSRPIDIRLINNRISIFEPEALDMLPPVYLHLEKNYINIVSIIFHKLRENSKLYMNNNNIQCIPDDVLERMRDTTIDVYLLDNPIDCGCLDRPEEIIGDEKYGKGSLYYNSTINCQFRSPFY